MRLRRLLGTALTTAAGAGIGLSLVRTRSALGPLEVRARLALAPSGGTRADAGPLGTARVPTHAGPLQLRFEAGALDVPRAEALLRADELERVRGDVPRQARDAVRRLAARAAVAGVAGGAALTALATRRPKDSAVSAGLAAGALGAAAARAVATIDRGAGERAELDGLLAFAPNLLGDLRDAPARLDRYRAQLVELLQTATDVQRHLAELPEPPSADSVRLVHVSDVHLSPLALPLARALVDRYDAAAVIDTGDLVDWGTPAEQTFASEIGKLGVPYVYIKGNHDSTGIAAAVGRQPNATVLDGTTTTEIAGLTIAGMPDPRFTADKTTGDDHGMPKVAAAAQRFADSIRGAGVDIALVHSPAAARPLAGLVPLVLAGDIHRREVRHLGHTTVLVQGSSGGAGLRGVQQQPPVPLMLSVLHLDRATRTLQVLDDITLGGLGRTEVSVVRRRSAELAEAG